MTRLAGILGALACGLILTLSLTAHAQTFPIFVWWQAPQVTGSYGHYLDQASAMAGERMTGAIGIGPGNNAWPERYGADDGEMEAVQKVGLQMIGGIFTDPTLPPTSPQSVQSVLALVANLSAQKTLVGYNMGDEPDCSATQPIPLGGAAAPAAFAALHALDPTRPGYLNQSHWMTAPSFVGCVGILQASMQGAGVASADYYPMTNPYVSGMPGFTRSNFRDRANDTMFIQGIATRGVAYYARPGQPIWMFVEAGTNILGSNGLNTLNATTAVGSTTLVNSSNWSSFTSTWKGLGVSGAGIPAGATIVSIQDATHATLSAQATASAPVPVAIVGGAGWDKDCNLALNLCVVNGNEYAATPSQVAAEIWMSIINGASGIEIFCHDTRSAAYCLGDAQGGPGAQIVQDNLTYIDGTLQAYAAILNAPTVDFCTMDVVPSPPTYSGDWKVARSCSGANGILTLLSGPAGMPGAAMVKSYQGAFYVLVQSSRHISGGGELAITIAGAKGQALTVYDSAAQYDPTHSTQGATHEIVGGMWSELFGQWTPANDYQTRIYKVAV